MPVRIYALAKELKVDSKKLVDLCAKAGIQGKGSALASLTDEETTKIKQVLQGGATGKGTNVPGSLTAGKAAAKDGPIRREDYIAPTASGKKMPVLSEKSKKSDGQESPPSKPTKSAPRTAPSVKLAPMPAAAEVTPSAKKSDEPAPQKPDLKLPADAIRASQAGSKPLAAHLRRHEQQRDTEVKAKAKTRSGGRGRSTDTLVPKSPLEEVPKGKGRRGAGKGADRKTEEGKSLLGGREQRQLNRRRGGGRGRGSEDSVGFGRRPRRPKKTGANTAAPRKDHVSVQLPCTVRTLSEAAGVPAASILRILLRDGVMGTITAVLDPEMTEFIADELGLDVEFKQPVDMEDELQSRFTDQQDDPALLETRAPVITFLGHVDHGKTSLLDRIIGSDVVSGESGGITQHIRAYEIEKDDRRISFVDTPGHEAFTEMRARGANVTDIAVLVVAADDGVMPQTEEAISHARAAEVPIVVALNKIDLPGFDENRIYQQLSTNELLPSEWGGDVEVIKTSATTGVGIDELLETLLTVAELHDFRANSHRPAFGTCLEAKQEAGRGIVAKVIVQNGALQVGDVIVCGGAFGRVKAMYNTLRTEEKVDSAGPSTPVNITGFDVTPGAGDHFYVLEDIAEARRIAASRATATRAIALSGGPVHVTLENLFARLGGEGNVQTLNIILRADVRGSIEAIQKEFTKLEHPEVRLKVMQATVGGVTEADVHLADASDAIIIGFNVVPEEGARSLAKEKGVQIRRYDVIYKITEDLKAALEGLLKPEEREVDLGRALVQKTYKISRVGAVAGCRVIDGTVERNCRVRVIRDNTIIGDYPLDTLRREKDDVKEVREGMECGMKLRGFDDIKEGDILETYRVEEVSRSFDE